jgi:hypothetical protein
MARRIGERQSGGNGASLTPQRRVMQQRTGRGSALLSLWRDTPCRENAAQRAATTLKNWRTPTGRRQAAVDHGLIYASRLSLVMRPEATHSAT